MRNEEWKTFVKKVARFGVRTGIFDCSLDWRLNRPFNLRFYMTLDTIEKADYVVVRIKSRAQFWWEVSKVILCACVDVHSFPTKINPGRFVT